jgi:hypothetical protein
VRLRRFLLALGLSAAMGLVTGCAGASEDSPPDAAATGGAKPSPTLDLKADTKAVCTAVVAAYDAEKAELAATLGELISASAAEDKAALAAAKAKGEVVIGRLTDAVDGPIADAADPEAKAALQEFVATFEKALGPEGLDDPAFEAKMDAAGAEAGKYCPALME